MATETQKLIRNVLETGYEAFNDEVIRDAKRQLIDLAGCMVSGYNGPGNDALFSLVRQWGGTGEATILVHGNRIPLPHAAMMNSLQGRSYDFECTGPDAFGQNEGMFPGHVPSSTVPAALAVAEYTGASGKDLLSAVILGGDLASRIAFVEGLGFDHPFDPVGTVNAFGVAALTARLMGLTEDQLINSFGILTNMVAGSFRSLWDGVMTFKLYGAMAARNGIIATLMAKNGFTGLKDPLFGIQGYFDSYCPKPYHPEYMNRDLGKEFYVKSRHKKYPSCQGNHNIIDCGLDILAEHEIDPGDIKEIIIGVNPSQLGSYGAIPFRKGDSHSAALFYQAYSAASVLLRKSARLEHYTEEAIREPEVITLCEKVRHVPTTQANPPREELTVRMNDGKEYSAVFNHPQSRGFPKFPLTEEELTDKYRQNIDFRGKIPVENAEKALDMLNNLEQVENVSEIIKLLTV
ncbi:MAG: MmgE/PrpD family protein [Dehalococcoidales bacterium]|nr:MmgE/PrpD family protein [Dehalococcoidales bacterium]